VTLTFAALEALEALEARPALLPLEDGEQYRFTFDMNSCVGCHSCEVACAEQNGTPVDEAWRRGGELESGTFPKTRRFNLSMACNHCLEPTCLSGCPTNAYEKLANGIVVHHPDECVGCQYCMWNCPYEVPVFDKAKRIVSKCDMCRPRIDAGQSPACVQACPTFAIGLEKVDKAAWRADHAAGDAPGLPPVAITLSTTRIVLPPGDLAGMTAADDYRVEPEDAHWPLVALTLLTQLSLGMVAATVVLQLAGAASRAVMGGAAVGAFAAGAVALGASLLHLGQPERALKALRNVRTSWLSREVALFSAFSGLSLAYAATLAPVAGVLAVVAGVAGVYASGRLYLVPARPVWNSWRTPVAFFATAAATGPLLAYFALDRSRVANGWLVALVAVAAAGTVAQVAVQAHLATAVRRGTDRQHQGTAHLLLERFGGRFQGRLALAVVALMLLAGALLEPLAGPAAAGRVGAAVVVVAGGELLGRWLFYVTVVPFRVAGSFFRTRP
jgi:Fe-S-cluster-containing dehydrogenase component/DMSO reductase anchor subunit